MDFIVTVTAVYT